jgi:hypothetical protein
MPTRKLSPIHPGEVLISDFLEPLGVSQYRLAKDISVPARRRVGRCMAGPASGAPTRSCAAHNSEPRRATGLG